MNSTIILNEASTQYIQQHATETFPNECCGFLYGSDNEHRQIIQAVRVANSREGDQRRRFEIAPLDYIKAEQYALENELQLLGIYHSHPNHPAIASEHDLAKAMPFFSYVIISIMDGKVADLKSWKLKETQHQFDEEQVLVQKKNQTV
jgi:Predicted metal-dependent protease of the PAD1/JAB1 superfamily